MDPGEKRRNSGFSLVHMSTESGQGKNWEAAAGGWGVWQHIFPFMVQYK